MEAAAAVEAAGLPMTGSPSSVLELARRKDRVNGLLRGRGLPVPDWEVWEAGGEVSAESFSRAWSLFPAIVKPVAEDGSVGIDSGAVVKDSLGLARRLEAVKDYSGLMVQAFVGTREINAGILGGEVLPLSEIVFHELPEGYPPLVGYEAKWAPGSPEDLGTRPVCPAQVPGSVAARIRLLALKAWRAVEGRGYGRVDFRLSAPDNLWILEVNPNPDLCPSAGLARAALAEGLTYQDLVGRILRRAVS